MENELMKSTLPPMIYDDSKKALIKSMYAKNATNDELALLFYMSEKYRLDILTKQIWCVKFGDTPAQIYAGRDGFLEIGQGYPAFDGMETLLSKVDEPFKVSYYNASLKKQEDFRRDFQYVATCHVYRKDRSHPTSVTVYESEYTTGRNLWQTKPRTMIGKVSESQALRKAFSISGIYSPEEMEQTSDFTVTQIAPKATTPCTATQKPPVKSKAQTDTFDWSKVNLDKKIEFKAAVDKEGKVRVNKAGKQIPYNGIWYHTMKEVKDALPEVADTEKLIKEFIGKDSYKDFTYGDLKTVQEFIPAWVEKFNAKKEDETIEAEIVEPETTTNQEPRTLGEEERDNAIAGFEQPSFNSEEIPEWER
jgi:phage recombination protein Bet